ncbi:3,4-dihydroxyphenylacetaldehyde synthase-like [Solenopsis invicta]|uniref:3,4-dihydroxyphenylacetaldehyde synthase-like n=1 Tax=Solenopsis invicta TaxID=13686 RepID=UPI00193DF795|nr:3,4-dihydroxyphenylacetaldehyde synthase-like [Solenopsis invicta]
MAIVLLTMSTRWDQYAKNITYGCTLTLLTQGDNSLIKELLDRLQATKQIYFIVSRYQHKLVARFVVCRRLCREEDIAFSWNEIRS